MRKRLSKILRTNEALFLQAVFSILISLVVLRNSINLGTFVTSIFFLIFFCTYLIVEIKKYKILKTLTEKELSLIEREIENPRGESNAYTLTENYIIFYGIKFGIEKYSNIVLVYEKTVLRLSGRSTIIATDLVFVTKTGKKYSFEIKRLLSFYTSNIDNKEDFYMFLKIKNYNILFGYTRENVKLLKKRYNIRI